MSEEKVDLEQVRKNLSEVKEFRTALSKCQIPGSEVKTIASLQLHLEDVINQLTEMLKGASNE